MTAAKAPTVLWSGGEDLRPMAEALSKHLVGDFYLAKAACLRLVDRAVTGPDNAVWVERDRSTLAIVMDDWATNSDTHKDVRLAIEFYVRGWTELARSIEQTRRDREEEIERRGAVLRVVTCVHRDPAFGGRGTYVKAGRGRKTLVFGQVRKGATEFKDEDDALDFCRTILQASVEAVHPGWSWDDVFRVDLARV